MLRRMHLLASRSILITLLGMSLFTTGILAAVGPRTRATDLGACGAGEGPVWDGHNTLLFSGGGNILQRNSRGEVSVFRADAQSNGLLFDERGRLVICESGRRRVTRLEHDGTLTVLADRFNGQRFNTPNDLTIDSHGRIYFTDPRYGPRGDMEVKDAEGRLVEGVYRIDGPGQVARVLVHEVDRPNGILVSPHDQFLYVADNNNNSEGGARKLWRFNLRADGTVDPASRKLIFDWGTARGPDGFKMDQAGRLYVAAGLNRPNPPFETSKPLGAGIYILSPQGGQIEFIPILHDEVTNCAFGGEDRKTLFVTAGGHLWSLQAKAPGWRMFEPAGTRR